VNKTKPIIESRTNTQGDWESKRSKANPMMPPRIPMATPTTAGQSRGLGIPMSHTMLYVTVNLRHRTGQRIGNPPVRDPVDSKQGDASKKDDEPESIAEECSHYPVGSPGTIERK
jgi:hypothetical protein